MKMLPQVKAMFAEFDKGLLESFTVKSECLHPSLRSKGKTTTLKAAHDRYQKAIVAKVSAKDIEKTAKNERIAKYRSALENGGEIQYEVNDDLQCEKMLSFCKFAYEQDWLGEEDFMAV